MQPARVSVTASGNPAFSPAVVDTYLSPARTASDAATMTIAGTAFKTILLLVIVVGAGSWGWASATTPVGTDLGTSLGTDYGIFGDRLRLLAALGTGIVSVGASRVDVRAYLGTQHTFGTRRDRWRSRNQ